MSQDSNFVIGIDLGTTNSTVAVVQEGNLTVIPVHGRPSMPSAVGIDPAGRLVVGQAAKNQAISSPENTVLSVKRLMGTDEVIALGGKSYRPEEISSLILAELKHAAEAHLGQPVTRAVITVPAFFNERQRLATQDAGRLAGLEVLRIINEPTAAALAYGAGQSDIPTCETLLVYDLGGGTFDVSVVTIEDGVVEVRASHGDIHLGGDDFDEALAGLGEQRLASQPNASGDPLPATARRRLKSAMEIAKIQLSDAPYATVREEYLTPNLHLDTEIARAEYEKLLEPWLEKTLNCLQKALSDADVTASDINKIMLVGGATRTPLVQDVLMHALRMEPRHEIDPDLVVAMGAAIQGAALAGQPAPAILIDITAHTYSMGALAEGHFRQVIYACCPIIRRGTALPVMKSEVFTTASDNQTTVRISVYQGESREPEENLKIGEFEVTDLSEVPRGSEIIVQFRIDLSGLLTVTATEKCTGLVKSVTIDTAGQHRINLDTARGNLAALFAEQDAAHPALDHPDLVPFGGYHADDDEKENSETFDRTETASLLASAKSLRGRAEKILKSGVSEADATSIRTALDEISPTIEARDWKKLEDSLDSLSDLLFYLED